MRIRATRRQLCWLFCLSTTFVTATSAFPAQELSAPSPSTMKPTGGPGGNFDWVIPAGQVLFLDTVSAQIVGGPGGAPTVVQNVVGGVVQVRDLTVEDGATLRAQGPNPLKIFATGDVQVHGVIDVSGFDAKDVLTLNTGSQPELGGVGGPGGGSGGLASFLTNQSTPQGGQGSGPFALPNAGGLGGEAGFAPGALGKDARRPGGGGGGRLAADQGSLFAGAGLDGHPLGTGAVRGLSPAQGGAPGPGAFTDDRDGNDFWGVRALRNARGEVQRIRGELPDLIAGYGGGAGGDAVPSDVFPPLVWTPSHDEKGGGGGGGGGALRVLALGRIVFGSGGLVRSDGGEGANGENTSFLDHLGGSGGSGSGGHVVLESATQIDFSDGGANSGASVFVSAAGGPQVTGLPTTGGNVSFGGPGGPGLIQLHVPNPLQPPSSVASALIRLPGGASSVADVTAPQAWVLLPFFDAPFVELGAARTSRVRTR